MYLYKVWHLLLEYTVWKVRHSLFPEGVGSRVGCSRNEWYPIRLPMG